VIVRWLGLADYESTFRAMRDFVDQRGPATPDEIWLLEHAPVFTLGMAAERSHLLAPGVIPVVRADRGGQVTYHGPGQLVAYVLLDVRRLGISVRTLVLQLEQAVIDMMAAHGIVAAGRRDAPGVYVDGRKLASLGLRIRRGSSYHGLALNVDMDLGPFSLINPCGMAGMQVARLADLGIDAGVEAVGRDFAHRLAKGLGVAVTEP
jgi:lipoyl(octanoyl) transferase